MGLRSGISYITFVGALIAGRHRPYGQVNVRRLIVILGTKGHTSSWPVHFQIVHDTLELIGVDEHALPVARGALAAGRGGGS